MPAFPYSHCSSKNGRQNQMMREKKNQAQKSRKINTKPKNGTITAFQYWMV